MSDVELKYRNYYHCPICGEHWEDEWDCTCDDRCPNCNASCSPYKSEDLDDSITFNYGKE
jgi:hypothetical protein